MVTVPVINVVCSLKKQVLWSVGSVQRMAQGCLQLADDLLPLIK